MTRLLQFHPEAWAELVGHAQYELPFEACGYLIGTGLRVTGAGKMKNVHKDPVDFYQLDPAELMKLYSVMDRYDDVDLLGFWHSHPTTTAAPSATDRLLAQPGIIYVVYSPYDETASAFSRVEDLEVGK